MDVEKEIPSTIEVVFCVDKDSNGFIISGADEWFNVDMLDGCNMDDNCILIPKHIDKGVYLGKLTYHTIDNSNYYNQYDIDIDIRLSEIQEYLPQLTPQSIDNDKQKIARLEKKIAELEPDVNFIHVEGNQGFVGEDLQITKVDDTTINLKVGHCCVYSIDANIPCEAFTGTMINLINEYNGFGSLIEKTLPWDDESNQSILERLKQLNE